MAVILNPDELLHAAEVLADSRPEHAARLKAAAGAALEAVAEVARAVAEAEGVTVSVWRHWDDNAAAFGPGSDFLAAYDPDGAEDEDA